MCSHVQLQSRFITTKSLEEALLYAQMRLIARKHCSYMYMLDLLTTPKLCFNKVKWLIRPDYLHGPSSIDWQFGAPKRRVAKLRRDSEGLQAQGLSCSAPAS